MAAPQLKSVFGVNDYCASQSATGRRHWRKLAQNAGLNFVEAGIVEYDFGSSLTASQLERARIHCSEIRLLPYE